MSPNPEFCGRCIPHDFCGKKSSFDAAIKFMSEQQATQMVATNPNFSECTSVIEPPTIEEKPLEAKQSHLPSPEKSIEIFSIWWSGMIEAGMSMDFQLYPHTTTLYAFPRIRCTENDPAKINLLAKEWTSVKGYSSSYWKQTKRGLEITGSPAADFAQLAKYAAPSRKFIIDLFDSWNHGTSEDKERIAQIYRNHQNPTHTPIPIQTYQDLLNDPIFFAGVLDAKGTYSKKPRSDRPQNMREEVRIRTRNIPLLEAIALRYPTRRISETKTGSRELRIQGEQVEALVTHLAPYLRVLIPYREGTA